jgi:DNA-binding CsgD family transcriptional regulator
MLTFNEHNNAEPPAQVLTRQLGRLTEQVQTILEQTRVLRERTIATRRQVQQSADSRRAGRAALALPDRSPAATIPLRPAAQPAAPLRESPMLSLLTKRMREILALLVEGKSEKEVATHLGLSPHTVHIHVTRMYARLDVNSRAELLARFYRQEPTRRAS